MKQRGLHHAIGLAICALMIVGLVLGGGIGAAAQEQDSTPESGALVGQEGSGLQQSVTPTPVIGSTSGQVQGQAPATAATESLPSAPSGPVASGTDGDSAAPVLAQGLVYLSGESVIWQVREVTLTGADTVSGNARVILQRTGATIVRADVTGKRTRLEPGEAFFAATGDAYTTIPDGNSPSTVWIFEVSNTNQVGEGAFYLSPDVPGYAEGSYDFEFTRYVVPAGGSMDFLGGDGPSLLIVLSGSVEVTLASDIAALSMRDGLVVDSTAVITAPTSEAVVVAMTLGPKVSDDTAAPPQAQQAAGSDTGTGDTADAPVTNPELAPASGEGGAFVTSIKVGAVEGVAVTVYADGQLAFDGWIEAGQWTEYITGSVFEVYTTSGVNTMFQNTCSTDPFWMDNTAGETNYVLEAGPSSCAPAG